LKDFGRRSNKMNKQRYVIVSILLVLSLALAGISFDVIASPPAANSPTLGAAASFSVLGGQTVTNTGPTTMPGDLGVSPGSALTGFPPGIVGPPGTKHSADALAASAKSASTAAFTFINQGCVTTYPGTKDLVGASLVPGVYCADAFTLSGTLTLSGSGVWIFKSAATLITSGSANVVGGDPCNVWWREVSSATLGTNTSLTGTILASTSITLGSGARLNGRALALTGAVTLNNNIITGSSCLAAQTTPTTPSATQQATVAPTTATTSAATIAATSSATTAATSVGATSATATLLPVVTGLPNTGGAPIKSEDSPWSLVIVIGLIGITLAFGFGHRYLNPDRPKK
jgi:hypothetical protein